MNHTVGTHDLLRKIRECDDAAALELLTTWKREETIALSDEILAARKKQVWAEQKFSDLSILVRDALRKLQDIK